jgi:uncharacterized protein YceH (UPF0502 family)
MTQRDSYYNGFVRSSVAETPGSVRASDDTKEKSSLEKRVAELEKRVEELAQQLASFVSYGKQSK